MNNRADLEAMYKRSDLTEKEVTSFFKRLECVDRTFMHGTWKGRELKTNHPLNGSLEAVPWYGKRFINNEDVHPLVFQKKSGMLYNVNPGLLPLQLPLEKVPEKVMRKSFPFFSPLLHTAESKARLRMIENHGKLTAAMIYDQHPIQDLFKKVDDNTVLGMMDFKKEQKPFFFILERVSHY
ncbi:DUF4334 domain-containing protein [Bacillus sp. FJAT-44742]|uniref:DUF4334 domain-containing protein n=1 Tax=Bacillus sp. FJAT-44742 TaxID=2014005 RepID=UPI001E296B05|nr:DUF4334 domain-containing protein [Bacillus sp. FJAT-44742]